METSIQSHAATQSVMRTDIHIFDAVRRAQAVFFKQHLRLRREEHGVRLVLEERGAAPSQDERGSRTSPESLEADLRLRVCGELAALLDAQPGARRVMRHLVFVENSLSRSGLAVLDELPVPVLQRALEQFEGLVSNWSPVGLATLRSRMAVSITRREHLPQQEPPDSTRPTYPVSLDDTDALPVAEECSDTAVLTAVYAALSVAVPGAAPSVATPAEAALAGLAGA